MTGLFNGRLTWRRFGVLLRQLPRDSRLARAIDPAAEWSNTDHLLALAVDALHGANWQRSGGKAKAPEPLKRPGVSVKEQQMASLVERLAQREGGDHAD